MTGNLSGGNQQKVVLSKWLFANPGRADPRRADARHRCRREIRDLHDHRHSSPRRAKAIIVISSEMPELLGITDRIYVMNEGRIVGEMAASDASQEKIMRAIVRGEGKAAS